MDNKIPETSADREDSTEDERIATNNMCQQRSRDIGGARGKRPYPYVGISTAASFWKQTGSISQREYIAKIADGVQRAEQAQYWGQHLWARGYFVASSGNVTDEIIAEYIRNQDNEERMKSDNFQISEL